MMASYFMKTQVLRHWVPVQVCAIQFTFFLKFSWPFHNLCENQHSYVTLLFTIVSVTAHWTYHFSRSFSGIWNVEPYSWLFQLSLRDIFGDTFVEDSTETSLTLMYTKQVRPLSEPIALAPMDVRTFKLQLNTRTWFYSCSHAGACHFP